MRRCPLPRPTTPKPTTPKVITPNPITPNPLPRTQYPEFQYPEKDGSRKIEHIVSLSTPPNFLNFENFKISLLELEIFKICDNFRLG